MVHFVFFLGQLTIIGTDSFRLDKYETLATTMDNITDRKSTNSPATRKKSP
jgi:hypothetical protein